MLDFTAPGLSSSLRPELADKFAKFSFGIAPNVPRSIFECASTSSGGSCVIHSFEALTAALFYNPQWSGFAPTFFHVEQRAIRILHSGKVRFRVVLTLGG